MLEKLRKKPKEVRDRYAFSAAAVLTGVVALIWLVSLEARLTDNKEMLTVEPEVQGVFSEFFGQARTNVASTISSFRSGYKEIQDAGDAGLGESGSTPDQLSTTTNIGGPEPSFGWATGTSSTADDRRVILIATSTDTEVGEPI